MGIAIALVVIIIAFILIKNIISIGIRITGLLILAVILAGTVYICAVQPDMHKPFSLDTIEYLLKFNKDGSVETTKQITRTVYKEQVK